MRGSGLFLAVVWLLGLILGIDALPDCQPTGAGPITIGKESYVCITINGKRRVLFTPKADEFTAIRLSGSHNSLPANTPLITRGSGELVYPSAGTVPDGRYFMLFDVSAGPKTSLPQKLFQELEVTSGTARAVSAVPVYTVIIAATNGIIDSVVFDEGCFFCEEASASCIGNVFVNATQSVPTVASSSFKSCSQSCGASTGSECDLKLFVTWTGTDSAGAYFQSANLRFSRFRQFGIGQFYGDIVSGVNTGVNEVVKTGGDVINGL